MHIWQHAYQDGVSHVSGINLPSVASKRSALITGLTLKIVMNTLAGTTSAATILNMASVRPDLHELFDSFEIGIGVHVGIFLQRMKYFLTRHSSCRTAAVVLSAFPRNEHIYPSHYNFDGIDPNGQPLKALWG